MLEHYATRVEAPPVALRLPVSNIASWRYRRVLLSGRFDARHQFLLDNQINRGRAGYHVLTPLELLSGRRKVLVDRGWVPVGASRELLPDIAVTTDRVTLRGTVYIPYERAYSLGTMTGGETGWPLRVQFIDFKQMARRLDSALGAMIVRLDPKSPYGYRREWQIAPMGPQRHLGYAVQWFALACALLVIYVLVNLRRVD